MTRDTPAKPDDAANPLDGQPPAPDELQDENATGENPNASTHFEADPKWKHRPEQYPATKSDVFDSKPDPQNPS